MLKIGESLKSFWVNQNIELQDGASELEIRAFEEKYNVLLPSDLRDYFLIVNGFANSGVDEEMISFLPLSAGFPAAEEWKLKVPDANSYFVFADFSISCHVYMIRLGDKSLLDTPIFITYDPIPQQIAGSFTEFAEAYLESNYKILFP